MRQTVPVASTLPRSHRNSIRDRRFAEYRTVRSHSGALWANGSVSEHCFGGPSGCLYHLVLDARDKPIVRACRPARADPISPMTSTNMWLGQNILSNIHGEDGFKWGVAELAYARISNGSPAHLPRQTARPTFACPSYDSDTAMRPTPNLTKITWAGNARSNGTH
jgi:hypothetical protein